MAKTTAENMRAYGRRLKIKVLSHYGKNGLLQCCWPECEVTDIDVLTLDHVFNDGNKHRRATKKGGYRMYALLVNEGLPDRYKTLCCNHQMKKELMRRRNEV